MLTKAQKVKIVESALEDLKKSQTLVFADFSQVKFEELRKLRMLLKTAGAKFKVVKKRLLRVMFEKAAVDFNPEQFEAQVGTVFSDKGVSDFAGIVYKFSRETLGPDKKERFKILGGFDLLAKRFMDATEVKAIGQLPPREVLLGQFMGAISAPMRAFLYLLDQKSKVTNNQ